MALMETLTDNFNDNSFNGTLWTRTSASVILEQNGRIEVTTTTAGNQAMYSNATYDLTGSYFKCILTNESITGFGLPFVGVGQTQAATPPNSLYFDVNLATGSDLRAVQRVASTVTVLATVTRNATSQRWLRIRESSGTTYWEYSPNGYDWTTLHSAANPITVTALYAYNGGNGNAFLSTTTSYRIDHFNIDPDNLIPPLFTNTNTFYTQEVNQPNVLNPPFFENTNSFYTQLLEQDQNLIPDLFTNTNQFYSSGLSIIPRSATSYSAVSKPTTQYDITNKASTGYQYLNQEEIV
jgi:hypothetical protein